MGALQLEEVFDLADPEFLTVTPLLLRLLELALTVAEAGFLFQGPRGGGEVQITR